ncbi:MAG: hypothetical protein AAGC60_04520 [Acidobacteriota bacterium]
MSPNPRRFRIELALDLHSAPIPNVNPNMRIFPLQNALIDFSHGDDAPRPAWYTNLAIGDELSFRLVDITTRRIPWDSPDYPRLVVAEVYFTNPNTGLRAHPFTEDVREWHLSEPLERQPSPVYSVATNRPLPTWNLVAVNTAGETVETLEIAGFDALGPSVSRPDDHDDSLEGDRVRYRAFELAVILRMQHNGWVNHYVFDPQMIVSETDNHGDGGGR